MSVSVSTTFLQFYKGDRIILYAALAKVEKNVLTKNSWGTALPFQLMH